MCSRRYLPLIGKPFVDGGRMIDEGFDCWGLVRFIYSMENIELPDYEISAFNSTAISDKFNGEKTRGWSRIERCDLNPIDIIAFRLDSALPAFVTHVGVYIGFGRFIHCLKKTGVVISRIDDLFFSARIEGMYRWIM